MRCWKLAQTKEYLHSGNKPDEELEFHIEICPECQSLMHAAAEEEKIWTELLFTESLPNDFTQQVMASLELVDIEPAGEESMAVSKKRHPKSRPFLKKGALWVASLLVVAMALTLYAQPSIADWVRSIFSRETSDSGMMDARSLGLVQNPHVKVKDKGYTIEINEVVADATRLVMGVKVTDPRGKPLIYQVDWGGLHIKDMNGNEIGQIRGMEGSNNIEKLNISFLQEVHTDELVIEANVNQIHIPYSDKVIKGKWDFKFKADIRKANALNITTLLHESYTTSEGLTIQMEKLVRTPSGVQLQLSTSLSGEAAKRSPEDMESQQKLMFHFENEQGEDISSVNNSRGGHPETIISQQSELQSGKRHWTYTFRYLPYDRQKLRFVLDGYSIPVKSTGSVEFVPSKLKSHPVIFKDQGDEITLSSFIIGQDPNLQEQKTVGLIQMKAKFKNEFDKDAWFVRVPDGREYFTSFRGSVSMGEIKEASGDPGFIVYEMTELPEKATLIRKVTDKWYSNVNWSFELPKGKPIPGLENVDPQSYFGTEAP
ncbi:DUF4179 domain-containing protein [Paenibacillus dokdonensis]|uniref:DUF4179 domain-containing protein n=1 Tax=Paenibacillus dokdonensis TaxID=2567944 RepID=A0ABU6GNH3_9BACL|nr:DUF4179 domain-containing protein [Paenibacillus dokdonensis]MEC0240944.1 DUF4179 domain-containing protein [Paenibacillus dokdonensis]